MKSLISEIVNLVVKELGYGQSECVYQQAILVELRRRHIEYDNEVVLPIRYSGFQVGSCRADIIIKDNCVLELKCVNALSNKDRLQLHNYLRITKLKLGYLINFNTRTCKIEIEEIIVE